MCGHWVVYILYAAYMFRLKFSLTVRFRLFSDRILPVFVLPFIPLPFSLPAVRLPLPLVSVCPFISGGRPLPTGDKYSTALGWPIWIYYYMAYIWWWPIHHVLVQIQHSGHGDMQRLAWRHSQTTAPLVACRDGQEDIFDAFS
jgi:hypothetical protein